MKTEKIIKRLIIYFGDLICILAGFYLSLVTFGLLRGLLNIDNTIIIYFSIFFLLFNVVFLVLKYYNDSISNFDSFCAMNLGITIFSIYFMFCIIIMFWGIRLKMPILLTGFVYSTFFCGSYRVCIMVGEKKLHKLSKVWSSDEIKNVIIMGAGEAGKFLANMLTYDQSKKMNVMAFIDDNKELQGRRIKGYRVFGGRESIPAAVKKYNADEIIIAIPHVDNSSFRDIVDICFHSGCKVRRFANMSSLTQNDLSKATISEINIEDLLGREPIKLDLRGVNEMIRNKVVLVTGGAGSIGSEICRQVLVNEAHKVVIFDSNENGLFTIGNELNKNYRCRFDTILGNIRDKVHLDEVMEQYRPQIVFHAAAYKHVPMVECNPVEAVANNVFGTENVMMSAVEHSVDTFTMISTDKAVNPTNVMGATKRITELLCNYMSSNTKSTKFSAVRFGNVLGSNGSVIPTFKRQIMEGGPITVTDRNIKRYFMTIPEAVQLVMEAASLSKGGELFVLDMGEMVKIYDLAVTMIRLSGLRPEKDIKIEIIGLRPGEKMYEELQLDTEKLFRTGNDRIFVFQPTGMNQEQFELDIKKLYEALKTRDKDGVFTQIRKLVPTYSGNEFMISACRCESTNET